VHVGPDGSIGYPYVSDGISAILGITPAMLQEDPGLLLRLIHPDDLAEFQESMVAVAGEEVASLWEGRVVRPDGEVRWLRIASRPRCGDADGTVRDGVAIDVTDLRLAEETARWRLHHDVLTGLPNRALFSDRLEDALARCRRTGQPVAVAFVDLDAFKRINDTFGHAVGDEVLRVIAGRVAGRLRAGDTVARHGGDELTMLLPGVADRAQALHLAGRVAAACAEPVVIGDRRMTVGCSIGLAIAPEDGLDAGRLLNRADAALYRAKQRGRGRVESFDDELADETEQRAFLQGRLRDAIDRGELHVAYQRQVDADGVEVGFEALARWAPAACEPVSPALFVPLA
jgi:diguanylate cyclase (GGDEF)-like protein/PAS domain S-box-containing protein